MKSALFLIAFGIILMWLLDNIRGLWNILLAIIGVASPFIIGLAIAFIMDLPMSFFERTILKRIPNKIKRPISYIMTFLLFVLVIFTSLFMVLPEFYNSIQELTSRIPRVWDNFLNWIETAGFSDKENIKKFLTAINLDWKNIEQKGMHLLRSRAYDWMVSTFNVATSVIGTIASIAIGFVFSIYVLFQKEKLIGQVRRLSLALFPKRVHDRLVYLVNLSNKTFSNFLSGQLLEAIIIGSMFFIAMKIFKFPYTPVISILIGITSFIPIVGTFIGAAVGTLLILVEDAQMAFWFIIMFLIIQQIEGNLIYPHVAGKTVGLPSMWVLVSVTLGGSLFGVMGIILFVPLGTIIYTLMQEFIRNRLRKKNINAP